MGTDTFWGLTATAWTAIYSLLTAGLLAVAAIAAIYAKRQWRSAREQTRDTRAAELEANRPYVIATVEPSATSRHLFDLVVKNIGHRPAFAVSIELDPPPVRARETDGFELSKAKMLNEPVSLIAPGQELRAFYDSHIERNGKEDLPTSHDVSLRYRDSSGHEFNETAVIDVDAMKGTMYTEVKTIHDVAKSLAEVEKTLKGAAVLGRRGSLEVDASVESRAGREQRVTKAQAVAQQRHDELVQQLLPTYGAENDAEDSRRSEQ